MAIYEFEGKRPIIGIDGFIHPQATIIGQVEIGDRVYIGAGAIVRADYGKIVIGTGSNIQENCVLHSEPETIAILEENVLVGHGAIIHGPCLLKRLSLVGMGAIISTGCELGEESLLGSGSLLPPGRHIPARKMAMGNPAVVVKDMTDNMLVYTEIATQLYQDLAIRCRNGLKLIEE